MHYTWKSDAGKRNDRPIEDPDGGILGVDEEYETAGILVCTGWFVEEYIKNRRFHMKAKEEGFMEIWKKKAAVGMVLLLAVSFAGCGTSSGGNEKAPQASQTQAAQWQNFFADLSTVDLRGNAVTKEVFQEKKLTMVNLWATWCGPCVGEIPILQALSTQYADVGVKGLLVEISQDTGTVVVGVSDEERVNAQNILQDAKVEYPQWLVSEAMKNGVMQIDGFPTTFFLDKNGAFVGEPVLGARSEKDWKAIIEERLQMVEE